MNTDAPERFLRPAGGNDRADLLTLLEHALRADGAAVVRLVRRPGAGVAVWVPTVFDALGVRVLDGEIAPEDMVVDAAALAEALRSSASGAVDPGWPMDSAWRGSLPGADGFRHIDDVPAADVRDVVVRGRELASEHSGPLGPPPSLLDSTVLTVANGTETAEIPLRMLFALDSLGFLPGGDDIVRIRCSAAWLRVDARFGSVFRRRGGGLLVSPIAR